MLSPQNSPALVSTINNKINGIPKGAYLPISKLHSIFVRIAVDGTFLSVLLLMVHRFKMVAHRLHNLLTCHEGSYYLCFSHHQRTSRKKVFIFIHGRKKYLPCYFLIQ